MKIVVICGRAARHPWSGGAMAARVCAALAQAGHTVHLRTQSVDDPERFSCCASIETFDSFDQTSTDWPFGFARWARSRVRACAHDVSLSLSRVVGAHVWMPIEPSAASWLGRARGTLGLKSLGITLTRHHGFLRTLATETLIVAPRTARGRIRRTLAIGPTAAGEATRLLHRVRGLGETVREIRAFSMIEPPSAERARDLRTATRRLLNVSDEQTLALLLGPQPVGRRMDPVLEAVAGLSGRGLASAALAKDACALHDRAVRLGASHSIRILPLTRAVDAALCAADLVVLPLKSDSGVFQAGGLSRMAATALRFGKPLVVQSGSPGYELARLRSDDQEMPGLVVDTPSREHWERALKGALDSNWRERAGKAALSVSRDMTFDRFSGDLLKMIDEVGEDLIREPDA